MPAPKYNIVHPTGNFCGISINVLPQFNSPTKNLFYSPSYACFDNDWRRVIRNEYIQKCGEWATMPIFLNNNPIYANCYPTLNLSKAQAEDIIYELLDSKIIPTLALYYDGEDYIQPQIPCELLDVAFVGWEQNQWEKTSKDVVKHTINARKALRKDALLYVHFSPDHGSGIVEDFFYDPITGEWCPDDGGGKNIYCDNNSQWWNWAKLVGVNGLYGQADPDWDINRTIDYINQFTVRFGSGYHGYPIDMNFIGYEIKAHNMFYGDMSEAYNKSFNDNLRNVIYLGMQPQGWNNG